MTPSVALPNAVQPAGTMSKKIIVDTCQLPSLCMEMIFGRWYSLIHVRHQFVWKGLEKRVLPRAALEDVNFFQMFTESKMRLRAFAFGWDPDDISPTMLVKPDGFTVHRRPVAQVTDAVRGKRPITTGIHAFDFVWHTPFGTAAVIGLATEMEKLHCKGYESLLGQSPLSWGWNIVANVALHNGESVPYPVGPNFQAIKANQRVRMIVDCDQGVVAFERGDEFFGIAFRNLPTVPLYPAVAAVYGSTEVSMYYMGLPELG